MKPILGYKVRFNPNIRGEYVTPGREYTIVAIQGNTVWVRGLGQTYIDWKFAVNLKAIEEMYQ